MPTQSPSEAVRATDYFSVVLNGFSEYRVSTENGAALTGTGFLDEDLGLITENKEPCDVPRVDVVVRAKAEDAKDMFFVGSGAGADFAQLACFIDVPMFDALKAPAPKRVVLRFALPNGPRVLVDGSFSTRIYYLEIDARELMAPLVKGPMPSIRGARMRKYAVAPNSQIGHVVQELLASYDKLTRQDPHSGNDEDSFSEHLESLLFDLRYLAHRNLPEDSPLSLNRGEFAVYVEKLDRKAADELRRAYDTIWSFRDLRTLIAGNKLVENTGELDASLLEDAARTYLAGKLGSPTLENILIGALLFAETVAFARCMPGPPASGFKALAGERFWSGVGSVIGEGIALLLTVLVAVFIDENKGVGFWAVLSVVTLIRWLRPHSAKQSQAQYQEQLRLRRLLADMLSIYKQSSHVQYNARLLRELLYDVEKKGAVFSPCVFSLLDKRIAREGRPLLDGPTLG